MKFPLFLLLLFSLPAAAAGVHMIGDIPSAETGACLGLTKADAKGEAQAVSRLRIAAVLKRLRAMKMDSTRFLAPLKFDLVGNGRSNQFGGSRIVLSMAGLDQYNNVIILPVSTGTVAHEIGHWIGHTMDIRGKSAYEVFRASAFPKCHGFDGYSTHLRDGRAHGNDLNETFAEVFSGYITAPNFLKQACPAGYDFMKDQVFRGELSTCKDPEKIKARIPLPRPRPKKAAATANPEFPLTRTAADGEHSIPMPRPRPKNLGENSGP